VAIEGGRLGADDVYQLAAWRGASLGLVAAVGAAAAVVGAAVAAGLAGSVGVTAGAVGLTVAAGAQANRPRQLIRARPHAGIRDGSPDHVSAASLAGSPTLARACHDLRTGHHVSDSESGVNFLERGHDVGRKNIPNRSRAPVSGPPTIATRRSDRGPGTFLQEF